MKIYHHKSNAFEKRFVHYMWKRGMSGLLIGRNKNDTGGENTKYYYELCPILNGVMHNEFKDMGTVFSDFAKLPTKRILQEVKSKLKEYSEYFSKSVEEYTSEHVLSSNWGPVVTNPR